MKFDAKFEDLRLKTGKLKIGLIEKGGKFKTLGYLKICRVDKKIKPELRETPNYKVFKFHLKLCLLPLGKGQEMGSGG